MFAYLTLTDSSGNVTRVPNPPREEEHAVGTSTHVWRTTTPPPAAPVYVDPAPYGYYICSCGYERAVGTGCGLPCV